ncbi:hypothetical protein ACFH1V_12715 [Acinetobacter baumannii]
MYAIIDSNLNVLEASICKIKLEDKLSDKLFWIAHNFGRQAESEKIGEFEIDELSDPEVCNSIHLAYQDAYDYKSQEISDNFKIVKWDSKQAMWV